MIVAVVVDVGVRWWVEEVIDSGGLGARSE